MTTDTRRKWRFGGFRTNFFPRDFATTPPPVSGQFHWRRALLDQLDPRPQETICDVGCGSGRLAVLVKSASPFASVYGFDPDAHALNRAEQRARRVSAMVHFTHATLDDVGAKLAQLRPSKIVSTFVLHHIPQNRRLELMTSLYEGLRSAGSLHLVEYAGRDGSRRSLGVMALAEAARFSFVRETCATETLLGRISIYKAIKS